MIIYDSEPVSASVTTSPWFLPCDDPVPRDDVPYPVAVYWPEVATPALVLLPHMRMRRGRESGIGIRNFRAVA